MADPDRSEETTPHVMPRWVKLFVIAVIVAILLVVILHLAGGGGPARHGAQGGTVAAAGDWRAAATRTN